jgi:hypothetical protein
LNDELFSTPQIANYLAVMWLCDKCLVRQTFIREHLFIEEFGKIRIMVHRTLANKFPTPEAVLNLNFRFFAKLLERKESITQRNRREEHF